MAIKYPTLYVMIASMSRYEMATFTAYSAVRASLTRDSGRAIVLHRVVPGICQHTVNVPQSWI